jgi:hypothetical protein
VVLDLVAGEVDDLPARDREELVAIFVALGCAAAAVPPPGACFDDQTQLGPAEVGDEGAIPKVDPMVGDRQGNAVASADLGHPALVARSGLDGIVGDQATKAADPGLARPILQQFLQADAIQRAARVGGEEEILERILTQSRRAVDDRSGRRGAGNAADDQRVTPVYRPPMHRDPLKRSAASGFVGDVHSEGRRLLPDREVGRGAEIAEQRAGSSRVDGGEPDLPAGVGRGMQGVDGGVEAMKGAAGSSRLGTLRPQSALGELIESNQLLLAGRSSSDRGIDLAFGR